MDSGSTQIPASPITAGPDQAVATGERPRLAMIVTEFPKTTETFIMRAMREFMAIGSKTMRQRAQEAQAHILVSRSWIMVADELLDALRSCGLYTAAERPRSRSECAA